MKNLAGETWQSRRKLVTQEDAGSPKGNWKFSEESLDGQTKALAVKKTAR
jgi:hypothetical protein